MNIYTVKLGRKTVYRAASVHELYGKVSALPFTFVLEGVVSTEEHAVSEEPIEDFASRKYSLRIIKEKADGRTSAVRNMGRFTWYFLCELKRTGVII